MAPRCLPGWGHSVCWDALGTVDHEGSIKLLSAIMADLPRLTGAACVDRHHLFDELSGRGPAHHEQEHARIARAADCCATCPARAKCPTVVVTSSSTITVALGMWRASTRVRTSIPPPPGLPQIDAESCLRL